MKSIVSTLQFSKNNYINPEYLEFEDEDWFRLTNSKFLPLYFLTECPNISWNWEVIRTKHHFLLSDPKFINNLNLTTIEKHLFEKWDFAQLCCNEKITIEFAEKYPHLLWNFSYNFNVTEDTIKNHPQWIWNYSALSVNPNISSEFIESNLDKEWNFCLLSLNPNLTLDFIEKYYSLLKLECHPNVTYEFYQKHPEYHWNLEKLANVLSLEFLENNANLIKFASENPHLTLAFIEEFLSYFNFNQLSNNAIINQTFLEKHIKQKWNFKVLTKRVNLSFIKKNIEKYWDWGEILFKSLEFAEKYYDKINWIDVAYSNSINKEFISNNLKWRWNWNWMSMSPLIDEKFVRDNKVNWNYEYLKNNGVVSWNILDK